MKNLGRLTLTIATLWAFYPIFAQSPTEPSDTLREVTVTERKGVTKLRGRADNTHIISSAELKKAACCNLGESFTTNPSVDVAYSDAATGARQIRLLGLAGTYVQMLTENIPNLRGAASPFGLSYIAGPWMQSISVSKGASSVKNGYEGITGQINIEMRKPQADQSVSANGYIDHLGKAEVNADGNIHLTERLSTALLLHGENSFAGHDENGDGFLDMPKVRQVAVMNRWAWMGSHVVWQGGVKFLQERRRSGQDSHHHHSGNPGNPENPGTSEIPENPEIPDASSLPLYIINVETRRWEGFSKQAWIFDSENDGNLALILSGSYHDIDSRYGTRRYDGQQGHLYASLMLERKWGSMHSLSCGLSWNYDHFNEKSLLRYDAITYSRLKTIESVAGGYAQYTLNVDRKLLMMAGLRYDYSSIYGSMVTPRLHARWNPRDEITVHGSIGRGYRTPHPMAEWHNLMAASRQIIIPEKVAQEDAWNMGIGVDGFIPLGSKTLNWGVEYYFTRFNHQLAVDLDSDPHAVIFRNLGHGKARSHVVQAELSFNPRRDLALTVAYRYTDSRTDFGSGMVAKPLTSKSKGLFTASWTPRMGIWQTDVTLAINGGGRMPSPYTLADGAPSWGSSYHAFPSLNAQVTRNWRHWSVYVGGENLTCFKQKGPIVGASAPWGDTFDATMVYGPLHGAVVYAGFRYNFTHY